MRGKAGGSNFHLFPVVCSVGVDPGRESVKVSREGGRHSACLVPGYLVPNQRWSQEWTKTGGHQIRASVWN